MKKSIFILSILLLAGSVTVMAQGGGQRRTVAERVERAHQKIDSAFKLEPAKMAQVDSAFAAFYRAQDKLRDEALAGGGQPDFQAMREKSQPLMDARDKELKAILGDDKFKIFKEGIEPTMRGGRPGGPR
jgi:phosphoglycerate-specific signal transduction histidine kinase